MKDYLANEVRNVVVLGHSGAGKSSVIAYILQRQLNVMERITMAQQH